eukprot:801130-Rhodomonas_salina.1
MGMLPLSTTCRSTASHLWRQSGRTPVEGEAGAATAVAGEGRAGAATEVAGEGEAGAATEVAGEGDVAT